VGLQQAKNIERRILVVDDEGLIAADIQTALKRLGYPPPVVANSGEEALACARSSSFDLALMDIHMAGALDGIATALAMKAENLAPVVYLTAYSDDETLDRAKAAEPLGYLVKPFTERELKSAIEISLHKHELEMRVRTSEAWLSATLRSVGEGIIATNGQCEITFLNPVAEQLTGWTEAHARNRPLMDVLGLFDEAGDEASLNPVFALRPGENRSYRLQSNTGARNPVEIECFENRAGDEVLGAILVLRDIRHRKEMEARLIKSHRMEALANLSGGLAHDFNNQLMLIMGYAESLCADLSGDQQEQAMIIKRAAEAAQALTAQLQTLSGKEKACVEVLNLHDVIGDVKPLIERSLGKTQSLALELGDTVGLVRADRGKMRQALLNLACNARDSMPERGEIRLECSMREMDAAAADSHRCSPGLYARIVVAHTGAGVDEPGVNEPGVDEPALARIFEPDFDKAAGGLDLSIAHSIIAGSGGTITAGSGTGSGRVFEILLPCVGTFRLPGGFSGPTVLLVEDEDAVRRMLATSLERGGYHLLTARSAEEALTLGGAYAGRIHVLLTDLMMPEMGGLELAVAMTHSDPQMKVLYISGYGHDGPEPDELTGMNILAKPFPASEMLRRVSLLLREEKAASAR
jgi:two-component system cell cycle sensor histidine kinase/response regulator CckA